MKSIYRKLLLGAGVAIAMTMVPCFPNTAQAQAKMKEMKGSEHLMMLNQVKTKKDLDALKTDDHIAMVCAKCKNVWVTRVKTDAHGSQILNEHGTPRELVGKHECAGCNSTMEVVGVGKGKETVFKHSCKACGDDSGFCCATTKDAKATKGMEKEKETK